MMQTCLGRLGQMGRLGQLAVLAAALAVTACSSPKTNYYTLSAPVVPAAASGSSIRVLVGPVSVPTLLDNPQLVVKNSENQVTVYDYQRWAGSLKTEIERVVAADLARDLATPNVWSYTQSPFAQYDCQVLIDVQNMDSQLGGDIVLDVLWTIKPTAAKSGQGLARCGKASKAAEIKAGSPGSGVAETTGRAVVREPVSGTHFSALVAAQSRAFDSVSVEIAKSIRP